GEDVACGPADGRIVLALERREGRVLLALPFERLLDLRAEVDRRILQPREDARGGLRRARRELPLDHERGGAAHAVFGARVALPRAERLAETVVALDVERVDAIAPLARAADAAAHGAVEAIEAPLGAVR